MAEFRFTKLPDLHQGHRVELAGARALFPISGTKFLYLRREGAELVASALFGIESSGRDVEALEAVRASKAEAEVVKVMWWGDKFFYEKQLRETGKIDRKAEHPEWVLPPKDVEV